MSYPADLCAVTLVVLTDYGAADLPPKVAEAFRKAPKRRNGLTDRRTTLGRRVAAYVIRQGRVAEEQFLAGRLFEPELEL